MTLERYVHVPARSTRAPGRGVATAVFIGVLLPLHAGARTCQMSSPIGCSTAGSLRGAPVDRGVRRTLRTAAGAFRPRRPQQSLSPSRSVQGNSGRPLPGINRPWDSQRPHSQRLQRPPGGRPGTTFSARRTTATPDVRPREPAHDREDWAPHPSLESAIWPRCGTTPEGLLQQGPSRPNRAGPAVPGCLSRPAGLRHRGAPRVPCCPGERTLLRRSELSRLPATPTPLGRASRRESSLMARTVRRQSLCNPPDLNARPCITCERSMNAVPACPRGLGP